MKLRKRPLPGEQTGERRREKENQPMPVKWSRQGVKAGMHGTAPPLNRHPCPSSPPQRRGSPYTVFLWVRVPSGATSPRGLGALLRHTHLRRRTVITHCWRYETVRVLPGTQMGNRITAFFRSSITHHLQMCDTPRYPGGFILQASDRKSKKEGEIQQKKPGAESTRLKRENKIPVPWSCPGGAGCTAPFAYGAATPALCACWAERWNDTALFTWCEHGHANV